MTKRLILIRHAKSSWDNAFADDHERVLNPRGRAAATAIGNWLGTEGHVPQAILCSDAARTQETAERIISTLPAQPKLELTAMLYHAAPDTVIDLVRKAQTDTIAVIGHNPGIGMAADMLVDTRPLHHRFDDYPTCATTVIDFAIDDWQDMQKQGGDCVAFVVPRDLVGAGGDID
ncbi:histidine phosphatase family protein [Yoonia sp. SS1-5]|uniref:Histidine phosphatase family protein n=1 Tax=Yoonia rhodophyticola TaxID=3137370 RepID=A0AAN0MAT4_9RHOB